MIGIFITVIAGICFLLAIVFAPLTSVVTAAATAPVRIIVGLYLFMEIKNVKFESMDDVIPGFLTILPSFFEYIITKM